MIDPFCDIIFYNIMFVLDVGSGLFVESFMICSLLESFKFRKQNNCTEMIKLKFPLELVNNIKENISSIDAIMDEIEEILHAKEIC